MKDFDLRKYLAENKLIKEEVSLDDFLKNQLTGIEDETEGMETIEREEWLDMFGGTKNESGFDDIYNLIKKGKNSHSIDFGDFKANYALKIGDDKIIIKYKVKKYLAENKLLKENIDDLFGEYVAQWSQGNYDYDFAELKPGPVKGSLVDDFTLGPDEYDDDGYARDYKMMRDYLSKNKSYELSQDEKEGLSQFLVQFSLEDDGETIKADIYYSPEYLAMVDSDELN